MSKHRDTRRAAPHVTPRQYITTGLGGAAMLGVGVLLAAPPGAPAPTTATPAVRLASFDSVLAPAPLAPSSCAFGLADCGSTESLVGPALAIENANILPFGPSFLNIIGPGGWLIVSVPNRQSWQARFAGPRWFHLDVPRHLHHYGEATLRRMR